MSASRRREAPKATTSSKSLPVDGAFAIVRSPKGLAMLASGKGGVGEDVVVLDPVTGAEKGRVEGVFGDAVGLP